MASQTSPYTGIFKTHLPNIQPYEELYKHLHQHPELSTQEKQTAATIAFHLKKLSPDLEIKTNIGGHGLIAILRNNSGPTILLRADFDGLPVLEKTGLPYASTATQVDDRDGLTKPVMHACGHDFHVTSLLAACETLLSARQEWAGTIIFLFQPAEERGVGAKAMLGDGLYDPEKHACPIPDVVLGQHVFPIKQGTVGTRSGTAMSAAESLKITIHGKGGHGSMPHRTIDPVVIASAIVLRLQTIVSREVKPGEFAVVTVGSVQAGDAENVIPFEAVIKLNTRSISDRTKKRIRQAIERIVRAECTAGGCEKEPDFEEISGFPLTVNDADVTEKLAVGMQEHFGSERYEKHMAFAMGSEDFGLLGSSVGKPYCFWFFGGHSEEKWNKLEEEGNLDLLPSNHSPFFAPVLQPTLNTGVEAMVIAALTFVGKGHANGKL